MWADHEEALRRAERYTDLSRSAFTIGIATLLTIGVLAIVFLWPTHG